MMGRYRVGPESDQQQQLSQDEIDALYGGREARMALVAARGNNTPISRGPGTVGTPPIVGGAVPPLQGSPRGGGYRLSGSAGGWEPQGYAGGYKINPFGQDYSAENPNADQQYAEWMAAGGDGTPEGFRGWLVDNNAPDPGPAPATETPAPDATPNLDGPDYGWTPGNAPGLQGPDLPPSQTSTGDGTGDDYRPGGPKNPLGLNDEPYWLEKPSFQNQSGVKNPKWHEKYNPETHKPEGVTTIHVNPVTDPARAGFWDAASQDRISKAQSGLYEAQAEYQRAQATKDAEQIANAKRTLDQADAAHARAIQENERDFANQEQWRSQNRADTQAQLGVTNALAAAAQTGYTANAPTLDRQKWEAEQDYRNKLDVYNHTKDQRDFEDMVAARDRNYQLQAGEQGFQHGVTEAGLTGSYGGQDTLAAVRQRADIQAQQAATALAGSRFQFEQERDPASFIHKTFAMRGEVPPDEGAPDLAPVDDTTPELDVGVGRLSQTPPLQGSPMGAAKFGGGAPMPMGIGRLSQAPQLQGAPAPLSSGDILNSRYTPPALKRTFGGQNIGAFHSALPQVSAQGYARLMPSERQALGAAVQATGTNPADYEENRRQLTANARGAGTSYRPPPLIRG